MCELLGASLKRPADFREYLKVFFRHSIEHPHGWGIMSMQDGKLIIQKESLCASESPAAAEAVERLVPQKDILVHIRYATVGSKCIENSHPFSGTDNSGRRWTLIHNGTIYSGMELVKYLDLQNGDTDSERIFLYLLDEINCEIKKNPNPDNKVRFGIVDRLVKTLSPRNKLNLMIFDGEVLYVHKNMNNTLSYKCTEDGVILSTQPLDDNGWHDLPMCKTFAFKHGEKIFEGADHGNVFIPTLDYITAMDAMNI